MQIPSQKVVSDNKPVAVVERVNFTNIVFSLKQEALWIWEWILKTFLSSITRRFKIINPFYELPKEMID